MPVDTFKQKDAELNNLRLELKSLQSQIESLRVYGCQKDSETSCLRSKIDELSSQLQQANANDKSAELQMFEARIKVIWLPWQRVSSTKFVFLGLSN